MGTAPRSLCGTSRTGVGGHRRWQAWHSHVSCLVCGRYEVTGTRLVVNSTFLAPPHLPITAKVAVPAWQAQINLANYRVLVIDALRASWLARHGLLEVGGGDCGYYPGWGCGWLWHSNMIRHAGLARDVPGPPGV